MQTKGRNSPEALAKPAMVPVESWVAVSETAKTVPLVPRETTTSPAFARTPNAAAALSPAPAPILIPADVVCAVSVAATILGTIASCPRQYSNTSFTYLPVLGLK